MQAAFPARRRFCRYPLADGRRRPYERAGVDPPVVVLMADEANREAANECAQRGQIAAQAGDRETAIRYFERSLRLSHSDLVAAQLARVRSGGGANSADGARRRPQAGVPRPATNTRRVSPPRPRATPEQEAFVREQLQRKDPYDVLGIQRSASSEDITRAYRKLSLRLHPDRNPAGTLAFQRLGAAKDMLLDPERRQRFDRFGDTGEVAPAMQAPDGHPFQGGGGIDPDELLRAFFGGDGMPPGARVYMGGGPFGRFPQRRRPAPDGDMGGNVVHMNIGQCMNILAILFVMLLFLLSSAPSRAPMYQLRPESGYGVRRETSGALSNGLDLPFWVSDDTALKLKRDRYLAQRVSARHVFTPRGHVLYSCSAARKIRQLGECVRCPPPLPQTHTFSLTVPCNTPHTIDAWAQIEAAVTEDWKHVLRDGCAAERRHRSDLKTQIAWTRNGARKVELQRALDATTEQSCDDYERRWPRRY